MTKRLEEIQEYVNQLTSSTPSLNQHGQLMDKHHSFGVSSCCTLLALRRGLNPELAAISGLMHDIYRYKTGISENHAHKGAAMARDILQQAENLFTEEETEIILSAIYHHGDKLDVHGEYDEVLKDADTLSPVLYSGGIQDIYPVLVQHGRRERLEKMAEELNLSIFNMC